VVDFQDFPGLDGTAACIIQAAEATLQRFEKRNVELGLAAHGAVTEVPCRAGAATEVS